MSNVTAEVDKKERAVRVWNSEAGRVRVMEARMNLSCKNGRNHLSRTCVKWGDIEGQLKKMVS